MQNYNPSDWYWIVAGDASRVWASARAAYVDPADKNYVAFLDDGGLPTRISSEQDLSDVLAPYGLIGPHDFLAAYAADKRYSIETGGITVDGAVVDTSRVSQAMITGAYAFAQASPSTPINFKTVDGWASLTSAQMIAIGVAVGTHVQTCFAAEAAIDADIASGKLTSAAQIDGDVRWPSAAYQGAAVAPPAAAATPAPTTTSTAAPLSGDAATAAAVSAAMGR